MKTWCPSFDRDEIPDAAVSAEDFFNVVSSAFDLALLVSSDGLIRAVSLQTSGESFGDLGHWKNQPIHMFLTEESIPKYESAYTILDSGQIPQKRIELNHRTNESSEFPISYTFQRFLDTDIILMLGRDLRPIAESQQQLIITQSALERSYEQQREFDTKFRILLNNSREAVVFLAVHNGQVRDINRAALSALNVTRNDILNRPFWHAFKEYDSLTLIDDLLMTSSDRHDTPLILTTASGHSELNVTADELRAAGERLLMVRLEGMKESLRASKRTPSDLTTFFQRSKDAFVLTDARGVIISANESFLELIDAVKAAMIKDRSLSDFLARGQMDLKMLLDNLRRRTPMRVYTTKLVSEFGSSVSVEITATSTDVDSASGPESGFGFILRDSRRFDAVRQSSSVSELEGSTSKLMELVGSAKLKEIVSESTSVVEKMCIETAVSLTRNNRVAAAEMLGLSRQSLYVKLRKYGLLKKDKTR